jgi:CHAT domain-containing protein
MESSASTNGDLDVMVEQLEMLVQMIRKKTNERFELQQENEKMAKQLEQTWKQLVNQVEKALYEESQNISREDLFQLKTKNTNLKNEKKETCEALIEVHKKNFHLEA